MIKPVRSVRALLFGLSEELAGDLIAPLKSLSLNVLRVNDPTCREASASGAHVVFCGADTDLVARLRGEMPQATIIVVSRHAEVSHWLDSMEAGATNYCAAPFDASDLKWVVESSMRATIAAA